MVHEAPEQPVIGQDGIQLVYTPFMRPMDWLSVLEINGEPLSRETFRKMRKGLHKIVLRQHPDSTLKLVALAVADAAKLGYEGATGVPLCGGGVEPGPAHT